MKTITATAIALAWTGHAAVAGPLPEEWVAADAKWVAHLDVEWLTQSVLGSTVLEDPERFDLDLDCMGDLEELGLEPTRDIFGITAYAASSDFEEDGVIIAVTNEHADRALERLVEHEAMREITLGGFPVHVAEDDDERHYLHLRADDRDEERRVVVISGDRHVLLHTLEVLDGEAPSLSAGAASMWAPGPEEGSILYVAVGHVDALPDIDDDAAELLSLLHALAVDVAEVDGVLQCSAQITAGDDEQATRVAEVVRGAIALGHLASDAHHDLAPLGPLAGGLEVAHDGNRVTIHFHHPSRKLLRLLDEMD